MERIEQIRGEARKRQNEGIKMRKRQTSCG